MKRLFFALLLICSNFSPIRAQYLEQADLESIKLVASNREYYTELLNKFMIGDYGLSFYENCVIYYGFALQNKLYNPYPNEIIPGIEKLYQNGRMRSVDAKSWKLLDTQPLCLSAMKLILLAERAPVSSREMILRKYEDIMNVIQNSGSGETKENAKIVIFKTDIDHYMDHYFSGCDYKILNIEDKRVSYEVLAGETNQIVWFDTTIPDMEMLGRRNNGKN